MSTLWLPLLLSSVIWAEEDYFHISPNATWDNYKFPEQNTTWDEARDHCQKCFKELTTITSGNVHLIVRKNASLNYWIGLRRSYNGTVPWSKWSNEDPVTYQNWYPGHPVPNKEKKKISICFSTTETPLSTLITTPTSTPVTSTQTSTVTTPITSPETSSNKTDGMCPILIEILECLNMVCNMTYNELKDAVHKYTYVIPQSVTPNTTTYSTTPHATTFSTVFNTATNGTTTESTTASNCILVEQPDPEVYIEDACVVLLSYGMWKEVKCNESHPFVCYDEQFFGQINISNVTKNTGNLSWSEAPGNITHYRVEITGNQTNQTFNNETTNLYTEIKDLVPGNLYSVQVFPVKCGRDLKPQNISFYTKPSAVENLTVVSVTTDSILLNWSKPEGGSEFYSVEYRKQNESYTQLKKTKCKDSKECNVTGLSPGFEYNFTVKAVVNENIEGESSSVSDYTKPSKVVNLTSTNDKSTAIIASWNLLAGDNSGYRYCLYEGSDCTTFENRTNCSITTNETIQVYGKTDGTKYCLCVEALTKNNSLSGEMVGIPAYTLPNTVILSLEAKSKSITASWTINGKYEQFSVTIETNSISADNYNPQTVNTHDLHCNFSNLKAGVEYNVTVVTLNGELKSDPVRMSTYTKPTSPGSAKATSKKTNITVSWEEPEDSKGATIMYKVDYHAPFWNDHEKKYTTDRVYTFPDLKSGTRYNFSVRVVAGNNESDPVFAYAVTEPEKMTLTLTMLCSSQTPLQCEKKETQSELLTKLNGTFDEKFHDNVHWKLKWVERKKNDP
ncbi:receptor-type tyrosine-protein phosphatase eta isoform X1 [Ctenopharyngodon idella]|uniref:receptor-type tyrosine-protein phosphatase eta isoform X1 n=1 Tax=Ctenopharyngodon idella TaxID=7959 RepID=UPI0022317AED|nr:receptor-type tyrosine-protein phosphatase eta isoform X1 [Ctenopharyngodon idella]